MQVQIKLLECNAIIIIIITYLQQYLKKKKSTNYFVLYLSKFSNLKKKKKLLLKNECWIKCWISTSKIYDISAIMRLFATTLNVLL